MAGIQLEIYFRRVIATTHICQKSNEQSVDRASESDFRMTSNFTLRQGTFVSRLLKTSDDTGACEWEKRITRIRDRGATRLIIHRVKARQPLVGPVCLIIPQIVFAF
ncbi:hypothetical protein CDAR_603611 [Caerostris darwini]|uniref:Uncharacterized protein n=1 Tax=Caerostris darwini TaxID=1538125 RepID=A0AAV4T394_9ARAC|nr:hypothetical protein CDAR_603611 [Caerostris darwini]